MKHLSRPPGWLSSIVLSLCLAPAVGRADLAGEVKAVLQDKSLAHAQVGIQVMRLDGANASQAKIIYKLDSEQPLIPASNLKIITTSAALDAMGPEFRFHTSLLTHDGDLVLWGDGDPTLGDAEMLRKVGWDVTTVFEHWAAELKKRGVTSVRNVIVDDSVFDQTFTHPNWPADQEHKRYVAQVGGVNLNVNCVDFNVRTTSIGQVVQYSINPETRYITVRNTCLTAGQNAIWLSRQPNTNDIILRGEADADMPVSVTIHDPSMFAATVLSETLQRNSVKVTGKVLRDRATRDAYAKQKDDPKSTWSVVAVHETPLAVVMGRANKDSMNLYAEALCKRLGHEVSHAPGSWENGTAAIRAFLEKKVNVPGDQFKLDDGCGLSKQNGISANAMTRVLAYDFAGANHEAFLKSLSIAGTDGTLEDRFKGTDLRGRVFGKSGFVSSVSTLSGYLKAANGQQWYAFSILMNGVSGVKGLQERIVKAIDVHGAAEATAQRD